MDKNGNVDFILIELCAFFDSIKFLPAICVNRYYEKNYGIVQ